MRVSTGTECEWEWECVFVLCHDLFPFYRIFFITFEIAATNAFVCLLLILISFSVVHIRLCDVSLLLLLLQTPLYIPSTLFLFLLLLHLLSTPHISSLTVDCHPFVISFKFILKRFYEQWNLTYEQERNITETTTTTTAITEKMDVTLNLHVV